MGCGASDEEAAAALEAKKDLADPPIHVLFLLQNAAQGSDASKQHQLQVKLIPDALAILCCLLDPHIAGAQKGSNR